MDGLPRIRRYSDPRAFLARAGSWLLEREVEHTLVLSVVQRLIRRREPGDGPPYLAVTEGAGGVEGCALRTPPWPLLVTDLPDAAVSALVADVLRAYPELPAVMGPEAASARFARAWASTCGRRAVVGMRERLFRLESLVASDSPAAGRLRVATPVDRDRLVAWMEAFSREADILLPDADATARRLIETEAAVLWEDAGRARSMAAVGGESPHTARIGFVFTPPENRGRGYAAACVAALSARLLARGVEDVVLFTDLANPTSNALYTRLGYRPVGDSTLWKFAPPSAEEDDAVTSQSG
jgi:RimJ/RimL family protein N-acetyltransferase